MPELWEKIKPEDLDVSLSLGFIIRGSFKSFLKLRSIIEEHLADRDGEFLVYSKASSVNLKIVKEKRGEKHG